MSIHCLLKVARRRGSAAGEGRHRAVPGGGTISSSWWGTCIHSHPHARLAVDMSSSAQVQATLLLPSEMQLPHDLRLVLFSTL